MKVGTRVRVNKTGDEGIVRRMKICGDVVVYVIKPKLVLRFKQDEVTEIKKGGG